MIKTTLYIGHNVAGVPTLTPFAITQAVERILGVQGYTAASATGFWQGMSEDTTVIIIASETAREAALIANTVPALCVELHQECIMMEQTESAITFVAAQPLDMEVAA